MPETPHTDVRSDALRLVSNGVFVLTACGPDAVHAATVTWVGQVSMRPPIVMVALRRNSHLAQSIRKAHRFALNILEASQTATAEIFFTHATAPADAESIAGQAVRMTMGRCPLLTDAMAWLECRVVGEPVSPGDHSLFLGEVTGAGVRRAGAPMVLGQTPWSYGAIHERGDDAGA